MKLEHIILGQLIQNPSTGYDIKKHLDTEARYGMATRPLSQIYNTLKRMVANGLVEFEVQPREGAGSDLKVYSLTSEGYRFFMAYLESPVEFKFRYFESDILWRIMYSFLVTPEVMLTHLERELEQRKAHILKNRNRDRSIESSLLTSAQIAEVNAIGEKLHVYGTQGIDLYVTMLEEWIEYFEQKRSMKN